MVMRIVLLIKLVMATFPIAILTTWTLTVVAVGEEEDHHHHRRQLHHPSVMNTMNGIKSSVVHRGVKPMIHVH
jgi:hypothetical protein